ncbi:TniQ family protein [Caulobacter henricii]|uniref:TniQ family protein n=1 Tax=Caulobacter henricii TaxID=69395 RepID=UPI000AFFEC7E|nr:TniQ family protein [Caulobacter henricii]
MPPSSTKKIRPVRFPLPLVLGESIRGYVGRVAEHNTYKRPSQLLSGVNAGLKQLWTGEVDVHAMAQLYGVEAEALKRAVPRQFANEKTLISYGVSYAPGEVRRNSCPVSPTGLKRSPHYRFLWSLRLLSFCPEDFSLLLFYCPSPTCGRLLTWSDGPFHTCAHCGLDLTTAKTPKIQREHRAYLQIAAGLVSFDQRVRASSLDQLSDFLVALSPFDILRAVMAIGRALRAAKHPLAKMSGLPRSYPKAMLAGMRFVLDQAKDEPGWDVTKAPPAYVTDSRMFLRRTANEAPDELRDTLFRLVDESRLFQSPRVATHANNLTIAARRLGVGRSTAKALMENGILRGEAVGGGSERVLSVVEEASLAELIQEAQSRISVAQLAEQYGLKSSWILEMATLGLIEQATAPLIAIAYKKVQLRKDSATAYLNRISAAIVRTDPEDPTRVLLRDVFMRMGPGPKPWLQAIMAPKFLPDGLGSFEPQGLDSAALNVTRNCAKLLQSGAFCFPPTRFRISSDITLSEAQEHLNCHPRDIAELIKAGALNRSGRGVCIQSVQACCRDLISTGELAARAEMPSLDFALVAKQRGLRRAYRNAGFWDRQQAEAAFDLPRSRLHLLSTQRRRRPPRQS